MYLPRINHTGYNVRCTLWGVAKRQGSGLWIRDRWFESIHPSHWLVLKQAEVMPTVVLLFIFYAFGERGQSHAA